jgi:hypothetical protein
MVEVPGLSGKPAILLKLRSGRQRFDGAIACQAACEFNALATLSGPLHMRSNCGGLLSSTPFCFERDD